MEKVGFLLKTYRDDFDYCKRLIKSFLAHNIDQIPLYIVVPTTDLPLFNCFSGKGITLLSDESITDTFAKTEINGIRPGYINQEIIKLAFWETRLCENYLCLDSDGIFVRDFFISDLMYDHNTPYTLLVEDNELMVEPEYYNTHWQPRLEHIRKIQTLIGLPEKRILTCHGFAILSAKVLASFKEKYLLPKSQTYLDILKDSPYEFSWYNLWLQYDKTIDIHIREPLFKYFHHKNHHIEYLFRGIQLSDVARGYMGITINSNYSRGFGVVSFETDKNQVLANYLPMKDILNILFYKVKQRVFSSFIKP